MSSVRDDFQDSIWQAIRNLDDWRRVNGWKGYDPFGIRAQLYQKFGRGEEAFRYQQIITDLEKKDKFQQVEIFHKLLDDEGYEDPKTFANFGLGYLQLFKCGCGEKYLDAAKECGDRLVSSAMQHDVSAWGHPFVWHTEVNDYFHEENSPNLYITSLVAHFLFDLGKVTDDGRYMKMAECAAQYVAESPYSKDEHGICFWYISKTCELRIHNANVFCASLLITTGCEKELGLKALKYSLADQQHNGNWYYHGPPREDPRMNKIDNYHSGFVLEALFLCNKVLKSNTLDTAIKRGAKAYAKMFNDEGAPVRFSDEKYPQDIHDAAQGICTFTLLSEYDNGYLPLAKKIANWCIQDMQSDKGYFFYRKLSPDAIVKFPYMRWSQAPMFKALAYLYNRYHSLEANEKLTL